MFGDRMKQLRDALGIGEQRPDLIGDYYRGEATGEEIRAEVAAERAHRSQVVGSLQQPFRAIAQLRDMALGLGNNGQSRGGKADGE